MQGGEKQGGYGGCLILRRLGVVRRLGLWKLGFGGDGAGGADWEGGMECGCGTLGWPGRWDEGFWILALQDHGVDALERGSAGVERGVARRDPA